MGVDLTGAQQARHGGRNDLAASLLLTAHRQHHGKVRGDELRIKLRGFIFLVHQGNGRAARTAPGQLQILPGRRLRAIEHRQDQASLFQFLPAAADALRFNGVLGLAQTGGVKEVQPNIPQLHRLLYHVAGSACHRGDDGTVEPGQQIQQGGLARIGAAHDGTVHALAQDGVRLIVADQPVQRLLHAAQNAAQMGFVQLRHIFLREIHPGCQMGLQGGEGILLFPDLAGQRTGQGRIGQRCPLPPVGRDQVHDRFGLSQAQFAVQERTAGVLAGGRRLRTGCQTGLHQTARHRTAAVAGKLHHILAGIAVGRTEKQSHALVKFLAAVHKMAEQCRVAFCLRHLFARVCRAEHPLCHGIALRTGQAHHRDAARTGGGGDGGNGRSLHSCSFLPGAFGRRGNGVLGASRRPELPRERTFGFYSLFYHVFSQKDTPTDGFFHIF